MDTDAQAEMLFNRLVKRSRHLRKWARRIGVDAYRLYDRDIPEIPLSLDLYGDAVAGALYQRPYEKAEEEEERWLEAMTAAAGEALGLPPERIFLKRRQRQRGTAQYNRLGSAAVWREVHEGGLAFRVNLSDYLDTGLFLDARGKRARLRAAAAGKRVLNLFAYTCSLSVCAAAGGAAAVDSVDLSHTYLDWGVANFALNRLPGVVKTTGFAPGSGPFTLCRMDAVAFLDAAARKRLSWDLIILDPPSFSNSRKTSLCLDIHRDYPALVTGCLGLLRPGGALWFSVNAKRFHLDAGLFPGVPIEDMGPGLVDEDFRGKRTPACFCFKK